MSGIPSCRPPRIFLHPPTFLCPRHFPLPLRPFSTSSPRLVRRKRPSLHSLYNAQRSARGTLPSPDDLTPYTPEERTKLSKSYTPKQLAAIVAGEAAVSPSDVIEQGQLRRDPGRLGYVDTLSKYQPFIDHKRQAPVGPSYDPEQRLKTEDEINDDLTKMIENYNEKTDDSTYMMRSMDSMRLTVGKEAAELDAASPVQTQTPRYTREGKQWDAENPPLKQVGEMFEPRRRLGVDMGSAEMQAVLIETGLTQDQVQSFRIKYLAENYVANQTRLGKVRKLKLICIIGDGDGLIGMGEGKNEEPERARLQAFRLALKNMGPIRRYEGRTIFGDVRAKVGATELTLMNRPPGFGVRCMHSIFEIARCVGITDMAARVTRGGNPMNVVKATIRALQSQRDPEEIARARGRKLVDVRKVYYHGLV